jgi:hypothetical protein
MKTKIHSKPCSLIGFFRKLAATAPLVLCLQATGADVTWFAFSDCHYGGAEPNHPPRTVHEKVDWINTLPGTPLPKDVGGVVEVPRGVIMAGDLIDNCWDEKRNKTEWANYLAEFGVNGEGKCKFPVYECIGNHDWNHGRFMYNNIKERNLKRKELGFIKNISENGYHYSWDWEGIHFIALNIFPGNEWAGEADTYGYGAHHPEFAREFLEKDLRENVGNSGRPVITIHHFRPIDENWWTYSAADTYHRILQDYNILVIMCGHQGGGVNNKWRGIDWATSNGELEVFRVKPDNSFVAVGLKDRNTWNKPLKKKIFFSYEESGLPAVVNNGDWAQNVTQNSASLTGKVIYNAASDAEATIYWGTKDGGNDPAKWEQSQKVQVKKTGEVFKTEISNLQPWAQYFYRCKITNSKGEAWAATSIPFFTRGNLPKGWDTKFIGYEQRPWGGAHQDGNSLTVRGSGFEIGDPSITYDNFQYAYSKQQGDLEIQAQLKTFDATSRTPLSGLFMRESVESNSKSVSLLYSKDGNVRMFTRSLTDSKTAKTKPVKMALPVRLKLVRSGNTYTGYASTDGTNWSQIGAPSTVEMPQQITAGIGVGAGNVDGSKNVDAIFDEIEIKKQ